MGRKGESTDCTHVYLNIGRSEDWRRLKWGARLSVSETLIHVTFVCWEQKDSDNSLDIGSLASHLGLTQWP